MTWRECADMCFLFCPTWTPHEHNNSLAMLEFSLLLQKCSHSPCILPFHHSTHQTSASCNPLFWSWFMMSIAQNEKSSLFSPSPFPCASGIVFIRAFGAMQFCGREREREKPVIVFFFFAFISWGPFAFLQSWVVFLIFSFPLPHPPVCDMRQRRETIIRRKRDISNVSWKGCLTGKTRKILAVPELREMTPHIDDSHDQRMRIMRGFRVMMMVAKGTIMMIRRLT